MCNAPPTGKVRFHCRLLQAMSVAHAVMPHVQMEGLPSHCVLLGRSLNHRSPVITPLFRGRATLWYT